MSARFHAKLIALGALAFSCATQAQLHAAIEHEDEPREDQPEPADTVDVDPHAAHAMHHAAHADAAVGTGSDHVAPPPPHHAMPAMTPEQMVAIMGMDDDAAVGLFRIDRLERAWSEDEAATAWDIEAWYGRDFDKLAFRSEGARVGGRTEGADLHLLWSHAIAPFWDSQLGWRHDFGAGPSRDWVAFGIQGLAPYWFELEATVYLGEQGRTALRFEGDYDLLLTQRLVLQPRVELNAYGKADPARQTGAGVSDAEFGIRLRYELRREIAPYVGIERGFRFGGSADFRRRAGESTADTAIVAGVRLWF